MLKPRVIIISGPVSKHLYSAGYAVIKGIKKKINEWGYHTLHFEIEQETKKIVLPWFISNVKYNLNCQVSESEIQKLKSGLNKNDVVILFEPEAISVSRHISNKKFIILPDQPSHRIKYTLKNKPLGKLKGYIAKIYERLLIMNIKLIPNSTLAVYGSQHAKDLKIGIDLRPQLDIKVQFENSNDKNQQLEYVFGGTLNGTYSQIALNQIEKININKSRFTIIGKGSKTLAERLGVKHNEAPKDFEYALSQHNVFILLGDYPVGVRTRLVSTLSQGLIVIAHSSVFLGMPELKTLKSIFPYDEEIELENILQKIENLNSSVIKELMQRSREFYQQHYTLNKTTASIKEWLNRL